MSEHLQIPDIEARLMGIWATEDESVSYNFFPVIDIETPGQLDISQNDNFKTFGYRVFIIDKTAYLTVIDSEVAEKKLYTIAELNVQQQKLTLATEDGETISLTKK